MDDLEIKIKTPADTAGLAATIKAVEKLTAATRESAKSAAESAAVFQEAAKSRTNNADMQQYLSGLTKEAKNLKGVNEVTKETTGIKAKFRDSLKSLQSTIPGFNFVVGAMKNPYVALIAVVALAVNALRSFQQSMKEIEQAVGTGKITTNFEAIGRALAQSKIDARELADEIERINKRPDTVEEQVARATADLDRRLAVEERADAAAKTAELAGASTPEERAAIEAKYSARGDRRSQRRLDAVADLSLQAFFRSANARDSGLAALPREQAALEAARQENRKALDFAAAQETGPAEIERLTLALKEVTDTINTPLAQRSFQQLQLTAAAGGDLESIRALRAADLENAQRGNRNVGAFRARADARLQSAEARFAEFSAGLSGSAESARSFGAQYAAGQATADALRPFNGSDAGPRPASTQENAQWEARRAEIASQWERFFAVQDRVLKRIENLERRSASQSQATQ